MFFGVGEISLCVCVYTVVCDTYAVRTYVLYRRLTYTCIAQSVVGGDHGVVVVVVVLVQEVFDIIVFTTSVLLVFDYSLGVS